MFYEVKIGVTKSAYQKSQAGSSLSVVINMWTPLHHFLETLSWHTQCAGIPQVLCYSAGRKIRLI